MDRIPADSAPPLGARTWRLRAEVTRPHDRAGGVLLANGTVNNGLTAYLDDGHLVYEHNYFQERTVVRTPSRIPAGVSVLGIDLDRVRNGPGRLPSARRR